MERVGLGILNLSYEQLYALTPFQFRQLYEGWERRERLDAIKRAELQLTIVNSNRWDSKQRTYTIQDLLPWYDDFIAGRPIVERPGYTPPYADSDLPQPEIVAKRLLLNWGYDPDEIKEDSPIWAKAQKQAIECISGGTGIMPGSDDLSLDGIEMHRADPAEWGPSPYEEDAFRVDDEDDDEDDAEELEEQWPGPM